MSIPTDTFFLNWFKENALYKTVDGVSYKNNEYDQKKYRKMQNWFIKLYVTPQWDKKGNWIGKPFYDNEDNLKYENRLN